MILVVWLFLSACSPERSPDSGIPANVDQDELHEYLYTPFDDNEQFDGLHRELRHLGQLLVRDCMTELGFDYIPFVPEVRYSTSSLSDEEYVEIYGFGYTSELLPPIDQIDEQPDDALLEDPNFAIQASLSPAALEAYRHAYPGDDGISGCQPERFKATIPRLAVFEHFYDGFADANQRAQADPRMQQLLRSWSECMESAGFVFADRAAMFDDLDKRTALFHEMIETQWEELERLADSAPNGDITALSAEAQLVFETNPTVPPEHQESLDALIEYEFSLARADLDCDYFDAADEIYDEYEKKFVDDNALAILEFLRR